MMSNANQSVRSTNGWRKYLLAGSLALAVLAFTGVTSAQPAGDAPPPNPTEEQPEVLTRGPVHEAFAQPVELQSQAAVVAPKEPPANIDEDPPSERPEGDNYVWVPGYWSWDSDRNDYIWVSACWRVAPANMSWVPGYWNQAEGGWEWIAGFWKNSSEQDIEYLPAPPEPESAEPQGAPPSPDQVWVPPCHYWSEGHYVPRRGYWLAPHDGWLWVPSHYVWTPRGHVFCEGHWDRSLERRGVLFSPVFFAHPVRAGFTFSPSIVVETDVLAANCFTYPRYCHYFFGDYYDDSYVKLGIFPRFEVDRVHTWYDPIFVYDRWHHRSEPRWEERERHDFEVRVKDVNLRPARTFREQEVRIAKLPEAERRNVRVAQPFKTVVTSKTTNIKFTQINVETRKQIAVQSKEVHNFRDQRKTWEAPASKEKVAPRTERGTTVTPKEPSKQPITPRTEERKTPPITEERKTPPTRTEERKTPPVTEERKTPPVRTEERKTPAAEERKTPAGPAAEHKEPIVAPRDVHRTEAERVKIPTRSVVGKEGAGEKAPTAPTNERQRREEPKGKDDGKGK